MNALKQVLRIGMVGVLLVSFGCETKPAVDPDAPKSAEWEACIADMKAYAECKTAEAGQIDSGIQKRIERQMTTKTNQSVVSEELCLKVLGKLPSDDRCVPK